MIEQIQQLILILLAGMGLALKPSKTCITYTTTPRENQNPDDFLGFHIQQFSVGKIHLGKRHDRRLDFKTIISLSEAAMKRHQEALKGQIKPNVTFPQQALIKYLNMHIRGWTNYYSLVCVKRCFTRKDSYLLQMLWQCNKRRHLNKLVNKRKQMNFSCL